MNVLKPDFNTYMPDIIDAYTQVFGEEYRDVIVRKIKSMVMIFYSNYEGVESYCAFLEKCQEMECIIKFFDKIGVDLSSFSGKSYVDLAQDENFLNLFFEYMSGIKAINYTSSKNFQLLSLKEQQKVIKNKIRFLNFLRGPNADEITEDNFDEFCKTEEYMELMLKVYTYINIHEEIFNSEADFTQMASYKEFVDGEKSRFMKLFNEIKYGAFKILYENLPEEMVERLDKIPTIEERCKAIFVGDIDRKAYIEYFSEEDSLRLEDDKISQAQNMKIYYYRLKYLKSMGADIGYIDMSNCYNMYRELIQRDDIQSLIPSQEQIEELSMLRNSVLETVQMEFFSNSSIIYNGKRCLVRDIAIDEIFYKNFISKSVCVAKGVENGKTFPRMFFTVRAGNEGYLDFTYLHELCHLIESSITIDEFWKTGFETLYDDVEKNEMNPYNPQKRKYEIFNETLADIFALEAREILHRKGIYILEPKEHIGNDASNCNTSSITKKMLIPLLNKYRKYVVRARMSADISKLTDVIGLENFEELNDIINKVDYLVKHGLEQKLRNGENEDSIVAAYCVQLERLGNVYSSMELYHSSHNTGLNGFDDGTPL